MAAASSEEGMLASGSISNSEMWRLQTTTDTPTVSPTVSPTDPPTPIPTALPTPSPTFSPTYSPTYSPTPNPTGQPTRLPTNQPSRQPTRVPTSQPSRQPSMLPSRQPSRQPTSQPSHTPTQQPSASPTNQPSMRPSSQPSMQPSTQPSRQPTSRPSSQPSLQPSTQPSLQPISRPSSQPSVQPSVTPTNQPSTQPSATPTNQPSQQPTTEPSMQPTTLPSTQPSSSPSSAPSYVAMGWGQIIGQAGRKYHRGNAGLCENGCTKHGTCEGNQNCKCYVGLNGDPQWTGPDCSLRTCPFDYAWVGAVVGNNDLHPRAECSNMGLCDRRWGLCVCFPGYDGVACQRTRCPNDCYGHGKCLDEQRLAERAHRIYNKAWDSTKSMGCLCDRGYRGADCRLKECPSGPDPLGGYGNEAGRDCSGRGLCDYKEGLCACFSGFWGTRCQHQTVIS